MQKQPSTPVPALLRDPIVWAVIAVNGVVALLSLFPLFSPNTTYLLVESYALVPISILGMIAPWVGLPPTRSNREKVFWGLWSLSLFFHLVIRVIYLVLPGVDSLANGGLISDSLYVLFYLPMVLSVLVRPDHPRPEVEAKGTRILEFAGAGVFVLALIAYFAFVPRFFNAEEYESWVPSFLMYWVFDAFILLSLFYLRQTSPSRDWKILFSLLLIAPSCWVITEMLELTFYMTWEGNEWPASPFDVLWYIPWIAITIAGRVRVAPVPRFFAAGHHDPDRAEMSQTVGRPGWLQVVALVLPLVHIVSNLLGVLDPSTRNIREGVVLISLVLLLGLASLHQKLMGTRTLALARRSRALEERQRVFAAALEQSPDAVVLADGGGVVRYGNQAFKEAAGSLDHVLNEPILNALPHGLEGLSDGRLAEVLADTLAGGRAWEGKTKAGAHEEEREELVTVSPVHNLEGLVTNWILIRRDMTYLNQLERQLRHVRKMETVGTLAGGIARDFHDHLGEIHAYGEFLKGELDSESPAYQELLGLLAATERTEELANQVLAFSREDEEEWNMVSLGSLVKEVIADLRPILPPSVKVSKKIEKGDCKVMGVLYQLRQVLLNVGHNAAQAMDPGGGSLSFELGQVRVDDDEASALELQGPGNFYLLAVKDTGRGMDAETLERVFDPFFTTKDAEKGTGLGLYLVRETVLGHGGGIRVKSEPNWGTLFQIYLPCVASSIRQTSEAPTENL